MTRTMTTLNKNKYFEKTRGSNCSRIHRIKLATTFTSSPYGKISNKNNSHSKNCNSCNDSGNCMKLLTERLARIEELVNSLYKFSQDLQNSKKNPFYNIPKQQNRMLHNIDLSSCKLDDLQKLVIFTTNTMTFPSPQISIPPKFIQNNHQEEKLHSENPTANQEEKLKYASQDSGYLTDLSNLKPSPAVIKKGSIETLNNENRVSPVFTCDNPRDCS